ncbi:hypothetical protein GCM10022270_15690 [Terriglobus aquaticus]
MAEVKLAVTPTEVMVSGKVAPLKFSNANVEACALAPSDKAATEATKRARNNITISISVGEEISAREGLRDGIGSSL